MLKEYMKELFGVAERGDATEESYYSTLEKLLISYFESSANQKLKVTVLPKKTEAGNPDFRVWDGRQKIVGYIEAKRPETVDLDKIEESEQLIRYLNTFPNLLLTNFLEFRFYRDGKRIDSVQIADAFIFNELRKIPPIKNEDKFLELLNKYISFSIPKIKDAKTLAIELAKRTRFLKDEVIEEELKNGSDDSSSELLGFFEAFQNYLIKGITKEEFADMYAQTITYGLFAARTRCEGEFNRIVAHAYIPQTVGILRDIFKYISIGDLPPQLEWIIDDIAEVLSETDVNKILDEFFKQGKGQDPIVHFYETFLAEYDPETREKRGVYYTPEPVVSYIVRSINHILKEEFQKPDGLASGSVTVLDPAAGTLTFLAEAAKIAVEEFIAKYGEGGKSNFIKDHILKNFYAFELMVAPYTVGHLKISLLLEALGYRLSSNERFNLYLTNTLEMAELEQKPLPGMGSLSKESKSAGKIKKEQPVLVIIGNPPYSGHSANKNNWIDNLLKKNYYHENGISGQSYYEVDGKPLGEKNPKWLQDDYVKFIRFAQWKIDQNGEGVIGFITNHSYLDNPSFRGMRQSLLKSFDEIYILNLHGNSLKKETSPGGGKDENVFDIRQGVSIAFFIKKRKGRKEYKVKYADLWGDREYKYDWLKQHSVASTTWKELSPKSEFYLLTPFDDSSYETYRKFVKITDIFKMSSVGIVTARDNLTIKWTHEEVWSTVNAFSKMEKELARQAFNLGKDSKDWSIDAAQKDLIESGLDREKVVPILYRPFDIRYTYYTGNSRGFICRPRPEVMKHILKENIALIVVRQVAEEKFNHAFIANTIVESRITLSNKGIAFVFPLYLYDQLTGDRRNNLNENIISKLITVYKEAFHPEDFLSYIYAILYSELYRGKYLGFLRIDFANIPVTKNLNLFRKLSELGKQLIMLHLLKSPILNYPLVKLRGNANNKIERLKYFNGKLFINDEQYFETIKNEIWQYSIGGYCVCKKWLEERKGKTLDLEEIKTFCKIVTAVEKTMEIQKKIDELYPEIEKDLIEF